MKGVRTLTAAMSVAALLAILAPAAASAAAGKGAAGKNSVAYKHYVACGTTENATPSHFCQKQRDKGAFFRSNKATVFYTVCVKFPTGKNLCAPKQEAVQGTLYVNEITSNIPGKHLVSWFVEGKRIGTFVFTVPN